MSGLPERCPCCGGDRFGAVDVLWPELIAAWELGPGEVAHVNLQQGFHCLACRNNLRMMALAVAILRAFGAEPPLCAFANSEAAAGIRALEINESFAPGRGLDALPLRTLVRYPEVDMTALPFANGAFDLVFHSDTLEHVADPVAGLCECRRVLRPGGVLAYTVPLIEGRLSRSRAGLPPSHHGNDAVLADDLLVRTEYGADAWRDAVAAGFAEVRLVPLAAPAAYALVGIA